MVVPTDEETTARKRFLRRVWEAESAGRVVATGEVYVYSCVTKSFSDHDVTVARTSNPAIAINPAENDPVASLSHPTAYGPTKPPSVPMLLMKARPPAAAIPVRKRVGIV